MGMVEKAELIEMAEVNMVRLLNVMHKSGLSWHDILRILCKEFANTLIQFEVEIQLDAPESKSKPL